MDNKQSAQPKTIPFLLPGSVPYFPDPDQECGFNGLVAAGGDLSVPRLVYAYRHGIFPWYDRSSPILWWSPDPRFVLFPEQLHLPARLARSLRQAGFAYSYNQCFERVIKACATVPRPGQGGGAWLLEDMIEAYLRLHQHGYAVSAETWLDKELVGGCYGVLLGRIFFGESMFHTQANASKAALLFLLERLRQQGLQLLDCQQYSNHLAQLGARYIARNEFLRLLAQALPIQPQFSKVSG